MVDYKTGGISFDFSQAAAGLQLQLPLYLSAAQSAAVKDGAYLFATATCPNCRVACQLLDKAGVSYQKLLANENAELATLLGIKQAPTLVVVKDGKAEKYVGVGDVRKFISETTVTA